MMNKFSIHISSLFKAVIVLPMLVSMLTACSDNEVESPLPGTGYRTISLRMTLDGIGATRTPSGDYDDGRQTAYENYINVIDGDFKALLFHQEAPYTLAAEVTDVELTAVEADVPTSKVYILIGKVPESMQNGNYKLMMLANWEGCEASYPAPMTPDVTTIDALTANTGNIFHYPEPFTLGVGRGIPMFGIKDCNNVVFRKNVAADLGQLHLLRAMAKVEVQMKAPSDVTITSATMTRVNSTGLAAPKGIYTQGDYVKNSYIEDYLADIHLPEGTLTVRENVPFTDLSDGRFIIYVPEYDNTSASAVKSRIHLVFSNGVEGDLDFKFYDTDAAAAAGETVGTPFDIKRNYYYQYKVILNGAEVDAVVDVIPYSEIYLDPDFGL